MAVQGDQPSTLYYFYKIKNLNLLQKDKFNSNVLHHSIEARAEMSMLYILAWMK